MNIQTELEQLKKENEINGKNSIEDLIDIKKLEDIFSKFSKLTGYRTQRTHSKF